MRQSGRKWLPFRLVQILAGAAALLLPVGLLAPAFLKARAAGQRTRCQSNLKQIGLALHNYHSTYGHMPPGAIVSPLCPGDTAGLAKVFYSTSPSVGSLAHLLPYMEQNAVYDEIPKGYFDLNTDLPSWAYGTAPFDTNPFPSAATNPAGPNYTGIPAWSRHRIKSYECPAADLEAPFNQTAGVTVGANGLACGVIDCFFLCPYVVLTSSQLSPAPGAKSATLNWLDYLPPTTALSRSQGVPDVADIGCTNYAANAGTLGFCDTKTTLWSYLQRNTKNFTNPAPGPGQIYSNTLNIPGAPNGPNGTLIFVQFRGPFGPNSQTRFTDIEDGTSNTVAFGETLGGRQFTDGSTDFRIAWAAGKRQGSFGGSRTRAAAFRYCSNHEAVNNFAFCDGSVRPISKIRDVTYDPPPGQWMFFQAVCGMQDGITPDYSSVTQ